MALVFLVHFFIPFTDEESEGKVGGKLGRDERSRKRGEIMNCVDKKQITLSLEMASGWGVTGMCGGAWISWNGMMLCWDPPAPFYIDITKHEQKGV